LAFPGLAKYKGKHRMKLFTMTELKTLTEPQTGPCVSLYLPTHRVPSEIQQDRIRLKNLLKQAEEALLTLGLRRSEAGELLGPAEKLLPETPFWKGQQDGLALFFSPDVQHSYILPLKVPEVVVVSHRFHLKPLLSLLTEGELYILALSQNAVRLFQASRFSAGEMALEDIPQSLAEALKYDDPEKQLQFHTGAQKFTGERSAMFHGHGVGTDDAKSNLLRFCQQLDRGLQRLLRNERAPLVVAGVDFLLPIYREANSYPHLLPEGVTGNPEGLSPEELRQAAWQVVEPYFLKARQEAAARYRELLGTGRASHDLKEIVPAASHGRVDSLFVAVGLQQWGAFDPETHMLEFFPEAFAGAEDLLDFAAIHTLLQGGVVFSVTPDEVPDGPPAAAVFRF
jgi:hypothetical protein